MVIFLSPHQLSLYCVDVNFVINIWDIDHKKNSPYPEHNVNNTFEKRENFCKYDPEIHSSPNGPGFLSPKLS